MLDPLTRGTFTIVTKYSQQRENIFHVELRQVDWAKSRYYYVPLFRSGFGLGLGSGLGLGLAVRVRGRFGLGLG